MHGIEIGFRSLEEYFLRLDGPMHFRFVMQPLMASIIAVRAAIQDAKAGRPAYLWAALTDVACRKQLLQGGWKDMRLPLVIAVTLDVIYQLIVHGDIVLLELLLTATLLAVVPYLLLRGPVNRILRRFFLRRVENP